MPTVSVVVPVYNESKNIALLIKSLELALCGESAEIVFVDDGSSDESWHMLRQCSSKETPICAIRLSRNFGKEAAIFAGLEHASGDAVIVMDGDLQHPPELVQTMLKIWRIGEADIVDAVKNSRGEEKLANRYGAKAFYFLMHFASGFKLEGATDFKLLDRKVVDALLKFGEYHLFFRGMIAWLGFRRVPIGFSVAPRIQGSSRWSLKNLLRLGIYSIVAFSSIPLSFILYLGLGTFAASMVLGIVAVWQKLDGSAHAGFPTVIILGLFLGSAIIFSLGLIGIYVGKIYEEVKRRPRYIVASKHSSWLENEEASYSYSGSKQGDSSLQNQFLS